jgi:hypothetical protein
MHHLRAAAVVLAFVTCTANGRAGLYYSGETVAELPSQWRGFLLDQRALRSIAVQLPSRLARNPLGVKYEEACNTLEQSRRQRKLSADEQADLGALYIRLGEPAKALDLLRSAQREHPRHFHIAANLGTAWQLQGDLEQAAVCLQEAVRLAPGKLQKAEEYHLKLVRLRQRQPRDAQELDDLFGVRFLGDGGKYEPGQLAAAQRKKLPSEAVALVQQLALWLPADARLLWQLAELANAQGDVRTAAAMMDGCVTEFGLRTPQLRQHRQLVRSAAGEAARNPIAVSDSVRAAHQGHIGTMRARSNRPLVSKLDESKLPPINVTGVTALPWSVLAETTVARPFKPAFAHYLKELDGKEISLSGFMQPLGEDLELGRFLLIEYPVGCWYCEMPELTGIVYVELPAGKSTTFSRGLVKIVGKLALNAKDPEKFLYSLEKARVSEAD